MVREFGSRLKQVSLLAPRDQLVASLRREYGGLVAPALLEQWLREPESAPGRLTSSPWPDRIEVERFVRKPSGGFAVTGRVVERTSADPPGGEANTIPVELEVASLDGHWLIVSFRENRPGEPSQEGGSASTEDSPSAAADVVRAYYRGIQERRYRDAYEFWAGKGEASGKSFEAFRRGFSNTTAVEVTLGEPGGLEAAAGSRYVEIPVRIVASLRNGGGQEFTGSYVLRRRVVDGASPEQRAWRIYSARVRQVRP